MVINIKVTSKSNQNCDNFVYNVTNPMGNNVFNFSTFVSNTDVYIILKNSGSLPCNCKRSQNAYKDHGNILTGDLRIIRRALACVKFTL